MSDPGPTGRRWGPAPLVIACVVVGFARLGLAAALHTAGLHPDYERGGFDLEGRRALLIATNQAVLGASADPTGVWISEVTEPCCDLLDAGMRVDVASPRGGPVPVDRQSLLWLVRTPAVDRNLVAGPDQSSGGETAQRMMGLLAARDDSP